MNINNKTKELSMKHINFTQFTNIVESGASLAGLHPDEIDLGEWTIRELHTKVNDFDVVIDILKSHIDGWKMCNNFSDYDDFIDGVLSESCIVGSEKYVKLPLFEEILKCLWKNYYNPSIWSLGAKLDKWIMLYRMGKVDKIGFSS